MIELKCGAGELEVRANLPNVLWQNMSRKRRRFGGKG